MSGADDKGGSGGLTAVPEHGLLLDVSDAKSIDAKSIDGGASMISGDGSTTGEPSISSSVSSLSSNALARQIEMRERVAAAFAALDAIRTPAEDADADADADAEVDNEAQEKQERPRSAAAGGGVFPTCTYWPAEFNSQPRPQPWVDARERFPGILERRFQYNFENGKVTASFETPPEARIKINVFRSGTVTDARIFWGKDLQYAANTRKGEDKEVDPEDIRSLCNDVYAELKASAFEEIADKVTHTAGEAVFAAQQALLAELPPDFCFWDHDQAKGTLPDLLAQASPEPSTAYPYNFGLRLRRLSGPGSQTVIHFYCLASDKCRRRAQQQQAQAAIQFDCSPPVPPPVKSLLKGTNLQPVPRKPLSMRTVVEAHLQDEHWQQLLQTGWAPVLQKTGPLGARARDGDYTALGVKEFRVFAGEGGAGGPGGVDAKAEAK